MQKNMPTLGAVLIGAVIAAWIGAFVPPALAAEAKVAQTGQTTSFAEGDDGDIQAGVPLPTPRFKDNKNGTVTDKLTGLIWLKDASCFIGTWAGALAAVDAFNVGLLDFGCTEYVRGTLRDWRLPNLRELHSLIDFGFNSPALSNAAGTAKATEGDPFSDVRDLYWSSTTTAHDANGAWIVSIGGGSFGAIQKDLVPLDVWPVRGGK